MSWHADVTLIARYAGGELDRANASSVEEHLLGCAQCRAAAAHAVEQDRLDMIFTEVRDAVERPRMPWFARVLVALGVREHVARLIAATPALTTSWFLAMSFAVGWAAVAAHSARNVVGFLVIAPLVPLAGVAVAFGRGLDPTYEVGVAAPLPGFRLFLLRASTVLTTTIALIGAASFALPAVGWNAAAWLLPALAVTTISAALATWLAPLRAAALTGSLWLALVFTAFISSGRVWSVDRLDMFGPSGQVLAATLAVGAALIVAARANRFDILADQGE